EIGGIGAAVVLAGPDGGMTIEDEFFAVGGIVGPIAPIGGQGLLEAAIDGNRVEIGNARIIEATCGLKNDVTGIAGPADNGIVGAIEGKLLRLAARGGDNKN